MFFATWCSQNGSIHPGTADDMMRIASADIDETAVLSIDDIRGQLDKRSTLEFQVTWSDGDVSWESWETVRKTAEVSHFLPSSRCQPGPSV